MRRSPVIAARKCSRCGAEYIPTGNGQKYCQGCRAVVDRQIKEAWRRKKYPMARPKQKCAEVCCVCGGAFSAHIDGQPYCNKHYQLVRKYGTPEGRQRERTCQYIVEGGILRVITPKGDVILADAADEEAVCRYSWCVSKSGYAVANMSGKVIRMHRYILGISDPHVFVDHRNHNTLDNRRENLRACTPAENSRNKRGAREYSGIRETPAGTYSVRITYRRKEIYIGTFPTYEEAVSARVKAEKKYHGDFGVHSQ